MKTLIRIGVGALVVGLTAFAFHSAIRMRQLETELGALKARAANLETELSSRTNEMGQILAPPPKIELRRISDGEIVMVGEKQVFLKQINPQLRVKVRVPEYNSIDNSIDSPGHGYREQRVRMIRLEKEKWR